MQKTIRFILYFPFILFVRYYTRRLISQAKVRHQLLAEPARHRWP
jgi:hypothetical protein